MLAFLVLVVTSLADSSQAKTLRTVMPSDLKAVDPTWSATYISRNHAYMIFDTLFAVDENFRSSPRWSIAGAPAKTVSPGASSCATDSNGTMPRRSRQKDCIASLERWAQLDIMGRTLGQFIAEYKVLDDRSFQIVLKERCSQLFE